MGVRAYTGLPGSGKTYRIVSDLLDLDKAKRKYFVIHNIPGLKHDKFKHLSIRTIDEVCDVFGINDVEFWSKSFQERLSQEIHLKHKKQTIIVIDEAQTVFRDRDPAPWLAYHRHYDQDVWLGTQNLRNVDRSVRNLVEFEVRGKKGPIFPFFIYVHWSEGVRVSYSYKFKNRSVFAAYKSFDVGAGKTGTRSGWLAAFAALLCLAALATGYMYKRGWVGNSADKKTSEQVKQSSKPSKGSRKPSVDSPVTGNLADLGDQGAPVDRPRVEVVRPDESPLVWVGRVGSEWLFEDVDGLRTFSETFPGGAVVSANLLAKVLTVMTWDGRKVVVPAGYLVIRERDQHGQVSERRIGDDWMWAPGGRSTVGNVVSRKERNRG